MRRPDQRDAYKGKEPSWLLKFREIANPRVFWALAPALGLAVLGLVFVGGRIAHVDLKPAAPTLQTAQANAAPEPKNEAASTASVLGETTTNASTQKNPGTRSSSSSTKAVLPTPSSVVQEVCNQAAKQSATTTYNAAMSAENAYHDSVLASLVGYVLNTLKLADENARHDSAVNKINQDYQTNLTTANCSG